MIFGSSPHSRGTHYYAALEDVKLRFIPALAGNTAKPHRQSAVATVHPRTRGEHAIAFNDRHAVAGSSPHSRGTPYNPVACVITLRFIPALAGNTATTFPASSPSTVHPRTRGEHVRNEATLADENGSSPHSRGTRLMTQLIKRKERFIPALAGNTKTMRWRCVSGSVHPRTRGEHAVDSTHYKTFHGSSPHSRGTR